MLYIVNTFIVHINTFLDNFAYLNEYRLVDNNHKLKQIKLEVAAKQSLTFCFFRFFTCNISLFDKW